MWQQWVNLIVGLWIILSAYLGFGADTMVANFTVSGLIVAGLALWGALEHGLMVGGDQRIHRHV